MRLNYSKLSSFRVWVMLLPFVVLMACSPLDVASSLLGGGPNVAASAQIGAENNQGLVLDNAPRVSLRPNSRVDSIDQSTNTEIDPLLLALLIIGWLAPSPGEIWRGIANLFRRKK